MLSSVLESCDFVAKNSEHVKINYHNIVGLLDELKSFNNKHYLLTNPFNVIDLEVGDLINFLLLYDAIDFCFWSDPKWSVEYDNKIIDGGFALLYKMLTFFNQESNKNIFARINEMSDEEVKQIFVGVKGTVIPLLETRVKILKDISRIVVEKMNSDFYDVVKEITTDTELFDVIVNNFPSFCDERVYRGKNVYFYKLAQLLTSDILHLRQYKENINVDYSNLIGCADYKIPQVLRNLGILEYSDELVEIIDSKQEIKENDPYEVEIRANTLVVINYIWEMFGHSVDRIDINDFIWLKGKDKTNQKHPYHLTRTKTY